LRCVEPMARANDLKVAAWLESMRARYDLASLGEIVIDTAEPGARARVERYRIYEFVPTSSETIAGLARSRLSRR
jgi:hypothetical protein